MPKAIIHEPGERFGAWTLIEMTPRIKGSHHVWWTCRCDCGTQRSVHGNTLRSGASKSCGCVSGEKCRIRRTTHGATSGGRRTPEFKIWIGVVERCRTPSHTSYKNYGGRGIRVSQEWSASFQTFLDDMGPKPSPKHSIERINNNGNYEKGNCCWILRSNQNANKRTTVFLTFNGETMPAGLWAKRLGMHKTTFFGRLYNGWSTERAITTPVGLTGRP